MRALFRLLRRGLASTSGVAAVEFAFIAPILIVLFFSTVEVSKGMDAHARVAAMASAAADLVAQATQISNADKTNIFAASTAMIYPQAKNDLRIVLTSVIDDGKGGGKVAWSDASSGSARSVGSAVNVASGVIPTGGSVIMAEVSYTYVSPFSKTITGPIAIYRTAYSNPRLANAVARVP